MADWGIQEQRRAPRIRKMAVFAVAAFTALGVLETEMPMVAEKEISQAFSLKL